MSDLVTFTQTEPEKCWHRNGWYHTVRFWWWQGRYFACSDCGELIRVDPRTRGPVRERATGPKPLAPSRSEEPSDSEGVGTGLDRREGSAQESPTEGKHPSSVKGIGQPPRYFTQEEVKAKDADLLWAMTWMRNEAAHLRERGTPQPALELAIQVVIERHGLSLEDPYPEHHEQDT